MQLKSQQTHLHSQLLINQIDEVTYGPRELLRLLFSKIFISLSPSLLLSVDICPQINTLLPEWRHPQLSSLDCTYLPYANMIWQEERVPFFNRKEEINQSSGLAGETCKSL